MTHIYRGRSFAPREGDPKCCRAAIWGDGLHPNQCTRKPKVERDVDGKTYGFCGLHDPEVVAARALERHAKWEAKWNAGDRARERAQATQAALKACRDAIEMIAAGHNDPRSLAAETLKLFPKEEDAQ